MCDDCSGPLEAASTRRRYCDTCRGKRAQEASDRLGTPRRPRLCTVCKHEFLPARIDSRTCSRICADVQRADPSRDPRVMQTAALAKHGLVSWIAACPICRRYFHKNPAKRIYCSDACHDISCLWDQSVRWEQRRRARARRGCAHCTQTFAPVRDDHWFCSRVCSGHYWAAYGVGRRRFAKATGPGVTPAEWTAILTEFSHRCAYCETEGPLTQDHVRPLVSGGRHEPANIVPACRSCNSSKRAQPLAAWLGFAEPDRLAG